MDAIINLAAIEILEEAEILGERARVIHPHIDPFESLSDRKFIKHYRLNKQTTEYVVDLVTPFIGEPLRNSGLTVTQKVLTTLRFLAAGSYQMDVGQNIHSAISQSSVSKAISEVCDALNRPEIFQQLVKFPRNLNELTRLRAEFYDAYMFPGIIGCVDCTHVAIVPPVTNHPVYPEHLYVNRKGYHSINVQLVCDINLKILNVCARYPGSTHDSFIFNNSNVCAALQNLHRIGQDSFFLLGDSGYPLRPWMMTPINEAVPDSPEDRYNIAQKGIRSIIERCNGVLKARFRCLLKHRVLHYAPEKASKIINTCVMLHNLCIHNNIPLLPLEADENLAEIDLGMYDIELGPNGRNIEQNNLLRGRQIRQTIVNNYFA